jgi:hypothetical protein
VIYNFTSYGEPRISFGVRLRLWILEHFKVLMVVKWVV